MADAVADEVSTPPPSTDDAPEQVVAPEPAPEPEPEPVAESARESVAEPEPAVEPAVVAEPEPAAEPAAVVEPEPAVEPAAVVESAVVESVVVEPEPVAAPEPAVEPVPQPEPAVEPAAVAEPEPAATPAVSTDPVSSDPVLTDPVLTDPGATPATPVEPTPSAEGVPGPVPGSPPVAGASTDDPKPKGDAGRVLGGIISAITSDEVDLTLDDGRPAVISRRNFDAAGTDPSTVYNPGDRIEGAVLTREDPKNRVVLSRAWAQKRQSWEAVAALAEANELITVPVTGKGKKGLVVDVQGLRGFVPASHVELEPPKDLSSYVGQSLELKIIDCDVAKERLVLSRRSQLMKEQRKAVSGLMSSLVVGETRTGTVASLVDYGAFVDLGGVKGLVPLSELDWSRVRHPKDVVSVGDEIEVKILDVKIKKKRISLSVRQLMPDPFESVPVGEVVVGTVTRLVDFGAFVDVGGGLEGLVHITELAEHRVFAPEEIVTPGEEVRVKVLSVDRKRRRVELSIRQATLL